MLFISKLKGLEKKKKRKEKSNNKQKNKNINYKLKKLNCICIFLENRSIPSMNIINSVSTKNRFLFNN